MKSTQLCAISSCSTSKLYINHNKRLLNAGLKFQQHSHRHLTRTSNLNLNAKIKYMYPLCSIRKPVCVRKYLIGSYHFSNTLENSVEPGTNRVQARHYSRSLGSTNGDSMKDTLVQQTMPIRNTPQRLKKMPRRKKGDPSEVMTLFKTLIV